MSEKNNASNVPSNSKSWIVSARKHFPAGLFQPAGSFRFSAEALLLATFPVLEGVHRALDLGAGCGVIGFALLCRSPSLLLTGLERRAALTLAARRNALALGFAHRYTPLCADLAEQNIFAPNPNGILASGSFDLAVANPPYRQRQRGRLPAETARLDALFETKDTQEVFCSVAATALKPGGRFCLVYPAWREAEITTVLNRHGLHLARVLPLAPKSFQKPKLLLIESLKADLSTDTIRENPLVLHEEDGRISQRALAFCPFLSKR